MDAELKHNRALSFGLCALACVTMFTYAFASSAAQSLFLSAHGARSLPYAWLGVAFSSVIATTWLSAASMRVDVVRLFVLGCRFSGITLIASLALSYRFAGLGAFCLYIWKDIYIIVLVELFWTFANVVFGLRSASKLYGWFCAAGSLGSVLGSLLLGQLAHVMGTRASLSVIVPMLVVLAYGCRRLATGVPVPLPERRPKSDLADSLQIIRRSRVLPALLMVVALAQSWLALVDFRFSAAVEAASAGELAQTANLSNVSAIMNALSFALQAGTAPLLRLCGAGATLLLMPCVAGAALLWVSAAPGSLLAIATVQVACKSLDYSLFRASKELIYIPLSYAEKTRGKAFIDILVYRFAKGLVSAILLLLAAVLGGGAGGGPMWVALLLWTLSIVYLLRRLYPITGFAEFRLRWPAWHSWR